MNEVLFKCLLQQALNLQGRAECALLPDQEDVPTARHEVSETQKILADLLEHGFDK